MKTLATCHCFQFTPCRDEGGKRLRKVEYEYGKWCLRKASRGFEKRNTHMGKDAKINGPRRTAASQTVICYKNSFLSSTCCAIDPTRAQQLCAPDRRGGSTDSFRQRSLPLTQGEPSVGAQALRLGSVLHAPRWDIRKPIDWKR